MGRAYCQIRQPECEAVGERGAGGVSNYDYAMLLSSEKVEKITKWDVKWGLPAGASYPPPAAHKQGARAQVRKADVHGPS